MIIFGLALMSLKNLWRQKLRTFLTTIAVVVGTMAIISLVSIGLGARNVFMSQLEAIGALTQVTVFPNPDAEADFFGGSYDDVNQEVEGQKIDEELLKQISEIEHVTDISPIIQVSIFEKVKIEGGEKNFKGYDTQSFRLGPKFEKELQAGKNFKGEDEWNKVIIGSSWLGRLGYEGKAKEILGKNLILTTREGYWGVDHKLPDYETADEDDWSVAKKFKAQIIGVTNPGPEERSLYITDGWGRHLVKTKNYEWPTKEEQEAHQKKLEKMQVEADAKGEPFDWEEHELKPKVVVDDPIAKNGYQTVAVQVDDSENVEAVTAKIKKLGVGALTAEEFLEGILRLFLVIQIVLGAVGGIALLVASIGIINTMVMAILERTHEIGLLRAVGASRRSVWFLFAFEAIWIGLLGGVSGVGIGFILSKIVNYFGGRVLEGQNFTVENIITFPWWLLVGTVAFAGIIGLLAGLYPAFRASRLNPREALRAE
jgi:ABC-type lipoprotein release transport system permease subunit